MAALLLLVKRLVPFLLNKYFKFNECKNGTQRLLGLQRITKQDFSSLRLGYVDDKNCLAELTVVLKLNHGPGNGRKSLPVCFSLALSFAQAKESAYVITLFPFLFFVLIQRKETKEKSSPARCSAGRAGQRT